MTGVFDMSFHEKSNAAMLAITAAVYGWYFVMSAGSIFGGGLPAEGLDRSGASLAIV